MKSIIKRPGEAPRIIEVNNDLASLRRIIGGGIETLTFATNACVLCDRESVIKDLPYNLEFCGTVFFGPVLFVGVEGDAFCDFSVADSFCSLMG